MCFSSSAAISRFVSSSTSERSISTNRSGCSRQTLLQEVVQDLRGTRRPRARGGPGHRAGADEPSGRGPPSTPHARTGPSCPASPARAPQGPRIASSEKPQSWRKDHISRSRPIPGDALHDRALRRMSYSSVVAYSPLIAARSTSGSSPSPSALMISSGSLTAPSGPDSRTRYASRASGAFHGRPPLLDVLLSLTREPFEPLDAPRGGARDSGAAANADTPGGGQHTRACAALPRTRPNMKNRSASRWSAIAVTSPTQSATSRPSARVDSAYPGRLVRDPAEPVVGGRSDERRHRHAGPRRAVVRDQRRPVLGSFDVHVEHPAVGQRELHRSGDVSHPVGTVAAAEPGNRSRGDRGRELLEVPDVPRRRHPPCGTPRASRSPAWSTGT